WPAARTRSARTAARDRDPFRRAPWLLPVYRRDPPIAAGPSFAPLSAPPSGPPHGRDHLLCKRLDLVLEEGDEKHENEVRDPGPRVALDRVQALLLLPDHDLRAHLLRRRLSHGRHHLAHELLSLRGRSVAEGDEDGLLDLRRVAPHALAVARDQLD